ncbi:MAG: DUF4465 domain-containing protein [Verrucomicrobiota bacterium]
MKWIIPCSALAGGMLTLSTIAAEYTVVDFETLTLPPNSAYNGSDLAGGFEERNVFFPNSYTDFGGGFFAWSGFSYSNIDDPVTPGFGNQFAVSSGTGVGGTGNYAVAFDDSFSPETDTIFFPGPSFVRGFYINNTTYAALSMLNGDFFAKKFGGPTGDDPDWFKVIITGRDASSNVIGTVEHYLADFRDPDNSNDFIQTDWQWIELTELGPDVSTLHFALSSSDTGPFGINTPAYFAVDDLTYVRKDDWVNKSDWAVNQLDVNALHYSKVLYADVNLANFGGQSASGWVVVILRDPKGRTKVRWRPVRRLASLEEKDVRVYLTRLSRHKPRGTYKVYALALPFSRQNEITLKNNLVITEFEW